MILKHRDKKILRFDWLEPHGVVVREVYGENIKFLPLEMKGETSDEDFLQKLIAIILDCDENEAVDDKISPPRDTIKNKNSLGDDTIISNLMTDPFITAEELGEVLSIGVATVKRRLAKLQSAGRIKRTGSRKTGAWEVLLK